jgi:hypothetical protein
MKSLIPKTAVTVLTAAAAMLAIPAMASAAPLHTAAKHSSTVSVSASPRVALAGTTVKLTGTVKSANPVPTGTITFWHGKTKLCSAKLSKKSAHCDTKFDTAGSYAVSGVYSGDSKHSGSTGKVTVVSDKAATSTAVKVSTAATTTGKSVMFTATVSSKSPLAVAGTVKFTSSNGTLGSASVSKGVAHYTYAGWKSAGSYKVTATYLGNAAHAASHATSGTITVKAAVYATTTTITGFAPAPVDAGAAPTVTVTVTSATGIPTGTVTVAATGGDAGLPGFQCTATLADGTGTCTITTSTTTYGPTPFVATYNGDATHSKSTGTYTLELRAPTITTATYEAGALTADVANPTKNNISPTEGGTGTVTFTTGGTLADGGTPVSAACTDVKLVFTATSGTGATAVGVNAATCAYTPTADGTVYANYSGDDANAPSTSSVAVTTGD